MNLIASLGYLIGLTVLAFVLLFGVPFAVWAIAVSLQ